MTETPVFTGKPDELLPEIKETMVMAVAAMADLDRSVVQACEYDNTELIDVFNRVASCRNEMSRLEKTILGLSESNSFKTGGEHARTVYVSDYGVIGVKNALKLSQLDQTLTRIATGISTRAVLRQTTKNVPG